MVSNTGPVHTQGNPCPRSVRLGAWRTRGRPTWLRAHMPRACRLPSGAVHRLVRGDPKVAGSLLARHTHHAQACAELGEDSELAAG